MNLIAREYPGGTTIALGVGRSAVAEVICFQTAISGYFYTSAIAFHCTVRNACGADATPPTVITSGWLPLGVPAGTVKST